LWKYRTSLYKPMKLCLLRLLILLFAPGMARADVKLSAVFGDHMVLQQDRKVPVWGTAAPSERVVVTLGTSSGQATADSAGKWQVNLPAAPTGAAPTTLTVAGKNTVKFEDVLVGDVWLCSGQSNMEYALGGSHTGREDQPKANDSGIRILRIPRTNRMEPQTDVAAKWEVCTPQTAGGFSAVAYYFARELRQTVNRPIGLIGSYWGGTPVQSWISLSALEKAPAYTNYVQNFQRTYDNYLKTKDAFPKQVEEYQAARKIWEAEVKPNFDSAMKDWSAAAATAKAAGEPEPKRPQPAHPAPREPDNPLGRPNVPSSLFNGMIAPLIPFALKGVIWYQGESNANNAASGLEYAGLFPRMINDWRERWGEDDLPFLFVQIAGFHLPPTTPSEGSFAWLRESQARTLSLPNTGMASSVDIGNPNDIHPKDKRDVGLRLAQAAKAVAYGQKVVPAGPSYDNMKIEGNKVRVYFKHAGAGVTIGVPPWTADGKPLPQPTELTGFGIAGGDQKFVWAKAVIEGDAVVVWSDEIAAPAAVRYGWADYPVINLYNKEGLPASPFRTDDWKP
jgi:sialate O-acetylesterase